MPRDPDVPDTQTRSNEVSTPGHRLFKALSHPVRLAILESLRHGPRAYTDLRRRVGAIAESPSDSRGKFNYHLDGLARVGLLERDDDAYGLTPVGRQALLLLDVADRRPPGPLEEQAGRYAWRDAIARATRGLLTAAFAGAFLVTLVILASAATADASTAVPVAQILLWAALPVTSLYAIAALTPLPDPALAPRPLARMLRSGAVVVLGSYLTTLPIIVAWALASKRPLLDLAAEGAALAAVASAGWLVLLGIVPGRSAGRTTLSTVTDTEHDPHEP